MEPSNFTYWIPPPPPLPPPGVNPPAGNAPPRPIKVCVTSSLFSSVSTEPCCSCTLLPPFADYLFIIYGAFSPHYGRQLVPQIECQIMHSFCFRQNRHQTSMLQCRPPLPAWNGGTTGRVFHPCHTPPSTSTMSPTRAGVSSLPLPPIPS